MDTPLVTFAIVFITILAAVLALTVFWLWRTERALGAMTLDRDKWRSTAGNFLDELRSLRKTRIFRP